MRVHASRRLPVLVLTLFVIAVSTARVAAQARFLDRTGATIRSSVTLSPDGGVTTADRTGQLSVVPPTHPAVGPLSTGEIRVRLSATGMTGWFDPKVGRWRFQTTAPMAAGSSRTVVVTAELVQVRKLVESRGGRERIHETIIPVERLGFRQVHLKPGEAQSLDWTPKPENNAPPIEGTSPAETPPTHKPDAETEDNQTFVPTSTLPAGAI